MKKNFIIEYVFMILFFVNLVGYSQINYSKKALTGCGDIELIGDSKLQKEVRNAFLKMQREALKEGLCIQVVSGYRSFNAQKAIWNRKYSKFISEGFTPEETIQKIIEYSSLPGASRHHWGTEIDIVDAYKIKPANVLIEENYSNKGVYLKLKKWMDLNSEKYGFSLVYTLNKNRKGFNYEPWHYSYAPISKLMLMDFLKMDLFNFYSEYDISGKEFFTEDFLNKYLEENVLDIKIDLK